jgi:hypothetical protein
MFKYLRISSYEEAIPHTYRYDFATASFWISLNCIWGKLDFFQCTGEKSKYNISMPAYFYLYLITWQFWNVLNSKKRKNKTERYKSRIKVFLVGPNFIPKNPMETEKGFSSWILCNLTLLQNLWRCRTQADWSTEDCYQLLKSFIDFKD